MGVFRGVRRALLGVKSLFNWCVVFNGTDTKVLVSDGAAIQGLHDDEITAEAWVRPDGYNTAGRIFDKTGSAAAGWNIAMNATHGVVAQVGCATTDARTRVGLSNITADGKWHHIVMYFNDAGDRKIYVAIDGAWVSSYTERRAGVDAIVTDVGEDLYLGARSDGSLEFDGAIGWMRISDNDRYSHGNDFTPQRTPPLVDAHTIVQYNFDEGQGTTLDNEEGTAAYDATLSNGTWEKTFPLK